MTRHGIVIPLSGLAPPPECKGGPAFCVVCNAEMIELEAVAIGLSAGYERRMVRDHRKGQFVTNDELTTIWLGKIYPRAGYREQARRLIMLRREDEGRWRLGHVGKGGRQLHADNIVAKALGLTLKQYRRKQHQDRAKVQGVSGRELYRQRRAA